MNTWFRDGQMAGTSGHAKRLEAIRIALTGEMAEHYDVYYRVHAQTYGWLAWTKNGEAAGTAGSASVSRVSRSYLYRRAVLLQRTITVVL